MFCNDHVCWSRNQEAYRKVQFNGSLLHWMRKCASSVSSNSLDLSQQTRVDGIEVLHDIFENTVLVLHSLFVINDFLLRAVAHVLHLTQHILQFSLTCFVGSLNFVVLLFLLLQSLQEPASAFENAKKNNRNIDHQASEHRSYLNLSAVG